MKNSWDLMKAGDFKLIEFEFVDSFGLSVMFTSN